MFFLLLVIIIIIIIHFFRRVFSECTEAVATSHHLYHRVTNFPEICAFIIGFSFINCVDFREKSTETSKRMLVKFVSICSYSPEVRTLGTLITSTKVFSLIICKTL